MGGTGATLEEGGDFRGQTGFRSGKMLYIYALEAILLLYALMNLYINLTYGFRV